MTYKEHKWSNLRRNGVKFELVIRDEDWKKIDIIKFAPNNFFKTMNDIGNRYGIDIKNKKLFDEVEEEIDWLKKESIL